MEICLLVDFRRQFRFGPAEPEDSVNIPPALLLRGTLLQNQDIAGPTNPHRLGQQARAVFIGMEELPHPAQITRRETGDGRIVFLKILRGRHRRALLWLSTCQPSDLQVHLHLRQGLLHKCIQRGEHGTVIDGFSDVHWLPLSGAVRLILSGQRKMRHKCRTFLYLD